MRRKQQLLSMEESISILNRTTSGVLAVTGDDGYPYAVPLSHVYYDNKLYFHSVLKGHKVDAILSNGKVSFCSIEQDMVIPEEYTTYFRSVIVFGKARILEDLVEKRKAIDIFAEKFSPNHKEGRLSEIDKAFSHLLIIELVIEHITGKESIELVKAKSC